MTNLARNDTKVRLTAYVMQEDQELQEQRTASLWSGIKLFLLISFLLLCLAPNVVLFITHFRGQPNKKWAVLERLSKQQASLERTRPDVKYKPITCKADMDSQDLI